MEIKERYGNGFEAIPLDILNEIAITIGDYTDYRTAYLDINQALLLIEFLKEQVDTFNNK
jgi:hypothetical protein